MIEKAVILSLQNKSKIDFLKYDFVYTGSEFCEYQIPSLSDIKRIKHNNIVLLTPIMTEKSFQKVVNIIKSEKIKEITVNDSGLFYYLIKNRFRIKINAGRILVTNLSYSLEWGKTKRLFNQSNAFEIDALTENNFTHKPLHFHTPFAYLTHKKNCITEYKKCIKCKKEYIPIKSKLSKDMYFNSNAYFIYKPNINLNLNIKRIIYTMI